MGSTLDLALLSAAVLGFRHGFDYDHIAAITDITSVESNRGLTLLFQSIDPNSGILARRISRHVLGSQARRREQRSDRRRHWCLGRANSRRRAEAIP